MSLGHQDGGRDVMGNGLYSGTPAITKCSPSLEVLSLPECSPLGPTLNPPEPPLSKRTKNR